MHSHHKKLYGTATVGTKGQVVIPAEAREQLDIKVGDKLYVIGSKEGKWLGLIDEDRLAEMVNHIIGDVELMKTVLDSDKQTPKTK